VRRKEGKGNSKAGLGEALGRSQTGSGEE